MIGTCLEHVAVHERGCMGRRVLTSSDFAVDLFRPNGGPFTWHTQCHKQVENPQKCILIPRIPHKPFNMNANTFKSNSSTRPGVPLPSPAKRKWGVQCPLTTPTVGLSTSSSSSFFKVFPKPRPPRTTKTRRVPTCLCCHSPRAWPGQCG